MIGKTIADRYKVYEQIGEGTVAEVFMGRDLTTNRMVAIKVIRPHLVDEGKFLERFRREAKFLADLDSPHAVQVYDYGTDGEINFIVLELIQGRILSDIIEAEGPMEVDKALELVRQIAECLQAAQQKGIVHRDIKPANVRVTADRLVKVMDFGFARGAISIGLTATDVLGTPNYISPEQADGKEVDTRTDIYSLGASLYEMLTGEVPYKGDTAIAIVLEHMTAPIPSVRSLRPDVPGAVDEIIARCMAKEPRDRYQTPAELVKAIDAALGKRVAPSPELVRPARAVEPEALGQVCAQCGAEIPPGLKFCTQCGASLGVPTPPSPPPTPAAPAPLKRTPAAPVAPAEAPAVGIPAEEMRQMMRTELAQAHEAIRQLWSEVAKLKAQGLAAEPAEASPTMGLLKTLAILFLAAVMGAIGGTLVSLLLR
jgi:tRNA A-37 threonylcarbamoyl transferase component Bud32